ncbi:MAG: hypothetical protein WCF68_04580 [Terriglobales bacterium]
MNARNRRHRTSGFSLIEMTMVVALGITVSVFSVMSLVPAMNSQHVTNAYNTTLSALRQARDCSVSQRTSYSVTFSNTVSPNTVTIAATTAFPGDTCSLTYSLPLDVTFQTNSTISSTTAPDTSAGASFGTGANAIDFGYTANSSSGGQTVVYFCPDGSAQTVACTSGVYSTAGGYSSNWDNGVVYMARGTDVLSSRAVSLWGGTGRIHGWRLYAKSGGGYQWVRQ